MGQVITRHRVKYSRGPEFEHALTKLAGRIARRYPGKPSHRPGRKEFPEREAIREVAGDLVDVLSFASDPVLGCPSEAVDELVVAFLSELESVRRRK